MIGKLYKQNYTFTFGIRAYDLGVSHLFESVASMEARRRKTWKSLGELELPGARKKGIH